MSLNTIFDIAGSGLSAETVRMSTSASNMTNANVVTGSADSVYKAQYPVFTEVQEKANTALGGGTAPGVKVSGIYESQADAIKRHEPNNPLADQDGFVYAPSVNSVEEMVNWISSSRSYEMQLSVLGSATQLIQRTLQLGQ